MKKAFVMIETQPTTVGIDSILKVLSLGHYLFIITKERSWCEEYFSP